MPDPQRAVWSCAGESRAMGSELVAASPAPLWSGVSWSAHSAPEPVNVSVTQALRATLLRVAVGSYARAERIRDDDAGAQGRWSVM